MQGIQENAEPFVGVMLKFLRKSRKITCQIPETAVDVAVLSRVCNAVLQSMICLSNSAEALAVMGEEPIPKTCDVAKTLKTSVKITCTREIGESHEEIRVVGRRTRLCLGDVDATISGSSTRRRGTPC
jgi:hypothetical protein